MKDNDAPFNESVPLSWVGLNLEKQLFDDFQEIGGQRKHLVERRDTKLLSREFPVHAYRPGVKNVEKELTRQG